MALTDGIKNKLTAIADAIRSKTNKTEKLTPEQMASEVSDIDTLQGLDFSEIYDDEYGGNLNDELKRDIQFAKDFAQNWDASRTSAQWVYGSQYGTTQNKVLPFIDTSNCLRCDFFCYNNRSLLFAPEYLDFRNCTNFQSAFLYASGIRKIKLITDKGENFSNLLNQCYSLTEATITSIEHATSLNNLCSGDVILKELRIGKWKNLNITTINQSTLLSAESIKYIIWYALNGENTLGFENEGATSRTLKLHATPYASWEEWKTTKPSVEDCEFLGIDETEITKYGELTWEDIALDIKLITIAK